MTLSILKSRSDTANSASSVNISYRELKQPLQTSPACVAPPLHLLVQLQLKEGESGTPFSFLCRDAAGDLPSSDFTKRIALKLQETLRLASMSEGHTNDTGEEAPRG